jgi:hypothetical protein
MRSGVADLEPLDAARGLAVELATTRPSGGRAIGVLAAPAKPRPGAYLVATDRGHDPAYTISRAAGLRLAREAGAPVVLYDRSSESYWLEPYEPATASPSLPGRRQLLEPAALRRIGYGYLADQLDQARAMGLDARAALPRGAGPAAMARWCQQTGVTCVILPATLARPSLRDRLLRRTLADFQAKLAGVAIVLVDTTGAVRPIQAQPSGLRPTGVNAGV